MFRIGIFFDDGYNVFMKISIFEMPLDFGASRHGSDMGPSAIKLAGLKKELESLGHEIEVYCSPMDLSGVDCENQGNPKARYLLPIEKACNQLANAVEKSLDRGNFPLVLGGDHSIVLGSLAGFSAGCRKKGKVPGVLYIDAHGDFNTEETTLSGNIHGMCMAASCGFGNPRLTELYTRERKIDPEKVCYIGVRDLDPGEKLLMKKAGVTVFTMTDIDRTGFPKVVEKALSALKEKCDCVHMSFDIDVMDPSFAPGVGIQVPGGLSYREVLFLMEELNLSGIVSSAEVVEVNPVLDVRNQTAKMAVEIIARLLGFKVF